MDDLGGGATAGESAGVSAVGVVVLLFIATGVMSAAISIYILDEARRYILGGFVPPMAGLRGGLTIGGVAAALFLLQRRKRQQAGSDNALKIPKH